MSSRLNSKIGFDRFGGNRIKIPHVLWRAESMEARNLETIENLSLADLTQRINPKS